MMIIYINNKKCLNFYKKWELVEGMCLPFFGKNPYTPIHGDLTFSNILFHKKNSRVFFIDPRGYYGKSIIKGDPDYDWAKLYYSLVGNYDQFNRKNFSLIFRENRVNISIKSNGWSDLEDVFKKNTNVNIKKIRLYHSIIWLSLTSYTWDDYDSICGAFYNGILLMQKEYEKSF